MAGAGRFDLYNVEIRAATVPSLTYAAVAERLRWVPDTDSGKPLAGAGPRGSEVGRLNLKGQGGRKVPVSGGF